MQDGITLVYLARLDDGFDAFEAFAANYAKHPAGCDHALLVVAKGFSADDDIAALSRVFAGVRHSVTHVPDDIGLDIHAYAHVVPQLDSEFVCFFNTSTLPATDDWLAKLHRAASRTEVGVAGATGSFESLHDSFRLYDRLHWAVHRAAFDRALVEQFQWMLPHLSPATLAAAWSRRLRLRRALGDVLHRRPPLSQLPEREIQKAWAAAIGHDGPMREFGQFPRFPNPHIRSTAFMLRTADFLAIPFDRQDRTKMASSRFESGRDGMSATLLRRGLELMVVGADGVAYPMEQWPECGAFRSGTQANLLATDKQTRAFDGFTAGERMTHRILSWGAFAADTPKDGILGVPFGRTASLRERFAPTRSAAREPRFSIAIPTHDRLALVLDAIRTVTSQDYSNWEIVVFDNSSREPIGQAIAALGDPRIRCERSDEFLPVTASWNRALNMATGEYVTLIGDDDGLAPGFFRHVQRLIERFGSPDLIFSSLYQFFHPGVVPATPAGCVSTLPMADFLEDREDAFLLDAATARRAVDDSLAMRRSFMFNMPAFTTRRSLLDRMRVEGEVLHSPFPDYYFANIALSLAEKIVAEPRPIAFQGVSKVSFGFALINAKLDEGYRKLNNNDAADREYNTVVDRLLPGSKYSSDYIVTMHHVARVLGDPKRSPDLAHYRRVQTFNFLAQQASIARWMKSENGRLLWQRLTLPERAWALAANGVLKLAGRYPRIFAGAADWMARKASAYRWHPVQVTHRVGGHANLVEVFNSIRNGSL